MIIFAIITVISSNPCLILHNELALTKFEICFRDLVKWRQKWKLSLKKARQPRGSGDWDGWQLLSEKSFSGRRELNTHRGKQVCTFEVSMLI